MSEALTNSDKGSRVPEIITEEALINYVLKEFSTTVEIMMSTNNNPDDTSYTGKKREMALKLLNELGELISDYPGGIFPQSTSDL